MLLIGQYDSSFVRRVGIALKLYGIPFEHRPWSTFGDADKIRQYNPLTRVPTLVLDDGEALMGTLAILDHVDSLVPAEKRLLPVAEPARRRAFRIIELAGGLADKTVALFYEKNFHENPSPRFVARCEAQIADTLNALEAAFADLPTPFWNGEAPGHADIAVAVSIRHASDSHPALVDQSARPALRTLCDTLEATTLFQDISQPFLPPSR